MRTGLICLLMCLGVALQCSAAGTLTLQAFADCDCNGIKTYNEANAPGVLFNIKSHSNCASKVDVTISTPPSGTISLRYPPCTYDVVVLNQTMLCSNSPVSQNVTILNNRGIWGPISIVCAPNSGSVSGTVLADCNCNGQQDPGEFSAIGTVVQLVSENKSFVQSESLGASNLFNFINIPVGIYSLTTNATQCAGVKAPTFPVSNHETYQQSIGTPGKQCTLKAPPPARVSCGQAMIPDNTGYPIVTGGCQATYSQFVRENICNTSTCIKVTTWVRTWKINGPCMQETATQLIYQEVCPTFDPTSNVVPTEKELGLGKSLYVPSKDQKGLPARKDDSTCNCDVRAPYDIVLDCGEKPTLNVTGYPVVTAGCNATMQDSKIMANCNEFNCNYVFGFIRTFSVCNGQFSAVQRIQVYPCYAQSYTFSPSPASPIYGDEDDEDSV